MQLKVTMTNGKEHILNVEDITAFHKQITNTVGDLKKHLVKVDGVFIVPAHISSVEENSKPKSRYLG